MRSWNACLVFVGSLNREAPYFQGARGVGLGVYSFDERTLNVQKLAETNDVDNPTFLSVTPDGSRLYANSEVFTWREGTVSAYGFDRASSRLTYLNKQPSLGSITAHNTITRDGTKLLVANYGAGEGGPDRAVAVCSEPGFRALVWNVWRGIGNIDSYPDYQNRDPADLCLPRSQH